VKPGLKLGGPSPKAKYSLATDSGKVARAKDEKHPGRGVKTAVDAELERVLVALTLEAARRIAQQELNLDPAKVAAVVRDAVSGLGNGARGVAVFVHPDDYAALEQALADQLERAEGWRLVADPEVLPGGCRVESEQASVVSSLDARAAGLAHTLLMQS